MWSLYVWILGGSYTDFGWELYGFRVGDLEFFRFGFCEERFF